MAWQQLRLTIPADLAEAVENDLLELGALSITLQDAQDEPILEAELGTMPLWSQTQLTALFEVDADTRKITALLQACYPDWSGKIEAELLADQNWESAWLEYFKPLHFGHDLWIVPSGYTLPDPIATNLLLDPGLAFGTGTHPTTAMCLRWLAAHDLRGYRVIDYGCGSGILAIAALKLGASEAYAIDYDPQALTATRDNAERNSIDLNHLHIGDATILPNDYRADVVLANILANPLIRLAPTLAEHATLPGQIVLSGILTEQQDDVLAAYAPYFTMRLAEQQEEWVCLAGDR